MRAQDRVAVRRKEMVGVSEKAVEGGNGGGGGGGGNTEEERGSVGGREERGHPWPSVGVTKKQQGK